MSETVHKISVEKIIARAKKNIENYSIFVKHTPKMLRQSMMLAYQTATDDMLKALDAARVADPIEHAVQKPVVLLDQNGHAT